MPLSRHHVCVAPIRVSHSRIASRRTIASVAVSLLSVMILPRAYAAPVEPTDVPPALAVPPHQTLVIKALGVGVQVYTCTQAKDDPTQFSWTFNVPEATLFSDTDRHRIGLHYGGPTWESKDGSKIVGTLKAKADSPTKSAIPWLLLSARAIVDTGEFGPIRYVLRLHTVGGIAPTGPCDASTVGRNARVPYAADYYFYAPSSAAASAHEGKTRS